MKKFIAFIFLVMYSVTSFGMTLHIHYCMGEIDTISFSSNFSESCKCNKISFSGKDCCYNKDYGFKLTIDQEAAAKQMVSFTQQSLFIFSFYNTNNFFLQKDTLDKNNLAKPPPLIPAVPLFIQYCVYRI